MSNSHKPVSQVVPPEFQSIFLTKCEEFNDMQSIVADEAIHSDENIVVAAPTGSGKTVIHELCIVRLMNQMERKFKCVLMAPTKALCQQRVLEWQAAFDPFGISVLELTGDIDMRNSMRFIAKASIIITTPEKWDSMTRSWRQHLFLLGTIDLLLIDEIHLLGEDRGATLEMVVVRMRMLRDAYIFEMKKLIDNSHHLTSMRIVALSATFANLEDVATWIDCKMEHCHYFSEDFRPVPLQTYVIAFGSSKNPFLFDKSLDNHVANVIRKHSDNRQSLVFCPSKNSAEVLAGKLSNQLSLTVRGSQELVNIVCKIEDHRLREAIFKGACAYHHAGLLPSDRQLVEMLFLNGVVRVLCSTTTLAHGVNLPAHLVVVKGTNSWRGAGVGYERTKRSDILQMLGRAGRPGFDTFGVAVIMTSTEEKSFYENMSLNADIVESHLLTSISEAICAEVSQAVIKSVDDAVTWLKKTYLHVRVLKNSKHYGIFAESVESIHGILEKITIRTIENLANHGIIEYNQETKAIVPLPGAITMTKTLITFSSMIAVIQLPIQCDMPTLLRNISHCEEISKTLRRSEKRILQDMLNSKIKYPLTTKTITSFDKSYILLQAAVSNLSIADFSLRVEQSDIVEKTLRLLSAIREFSFSKSYGLLLQQAINLDRCLRCRLWDDSYPCVFVQCPGLSSESIISDLVTIGIREFEHVPESYETLQRLINCNQHDARLLVSYAEVCRNAKLLVSATIVDHNLRVDVYPASTRYQTSSSSLHSNDISTPRYTLICYHVPTAILLCYREVSSNLTQQTQDNSNIYTYEVNIDSSYKLEDIRCCLISDTIGIDSFFNKGISSPTKVATNMNDQRLKNPKGSKSKSNQPSNSNLAKKKTSTKNPSTSSKPQSNLTDYGYFPAQNLSGDMDLTANEVTQTQITPSRAETTTRQQPSLNVPSTSAASITTNRNTIPHPMTDIRSPNKYLPAKKPLLSSQSDNVSPDLQTLRRKSSLLLQAIQPYSKQQHGAYDDNVYNASTFLSFSHPSSLPTQSYANINFDQFRYVEPEIPSVPSSYPSNVAVVTQQPIPTEKLKDYFFDDDAHAYDASYDNIMVQDQPYSGYAYPPNTSAYVPMYQPHLSPTSNWPANKAPRYGYDDNPMHSALTAGMTPQHVVSDYNYNLATSNHEKSQTSDWRFIGNYVSPRSKVPPENPTSKEDRFTELFL